MFPALACPFTLPPSWLRDDGHKCGGTMTCENYAQ